jgi:LysM repeat protein
MTGRSRRSRGLARLVAVLALAGFVIAFLVVLSNSGTNNSPSTTTPPSNSTPSSTTESTTNTTSKFAHRRTYVVKTGDTLGAIAIKTGVSVSTLEDLNPGLDPQGLVAGQKLKLRE